MKSHQPLKTRALSPETDFKRKPLVTYNKVISQLDNITLYGSDFRICSKTNLIS